MLAGVAGNAVSASVLVTLTPQVFVTTRDNVPVVKVLGMFMTMLLPLLVAMLHPAGTVQLYVDAPVTAVTL
jgi:hypothetical protein